MSSKLATRWLVLAALGVTAVLGVVALGPARAEAAFGDLFGIAPVNDGGGPAQESPAYPGSDAWWAGACHIDDAPAPGGAVPPPGIGALPANILAPNSNGIAPSQASVPAPPLPPHCIDRGAEGFYPGANLWNIPPAWRLPAAVQAAGHPDGSATFAFRRVDGAVDGAVDNIVVDLPAGFVGDPNAVPKCSAEAFAQKPLQCPPETQVGVLHLELLSSLYGNVGGNAANDLEIVPVYNIEPRRGNAAELGFANLGDLDVAQARLVAKVRTAGDFGVTTFIGQIPAALPVISQTITIWGVPWAASHDRWRAPQGHSRVLGSPCGTQPGATAAANVIPAAGFVGPGCAQSYDPSWGDGVIRPFITNLSECSPVNPTTALAVDSFQNPGTLAADGLPDLGDSNWRRYSAPADRVSGCAKPPFEPDATFTPTSSVADGSSGLVAEVRLPQNRGLPFDPPASGADQGEIDAYVAAATAHWRSDEGLATAQLDKTVVDFPQGVSVNPSGATGLRACPDAVVGLRQYGNPPLFNDVDPFDGEGVECPDASKIGTVEVETPLLDEPLRGDVVLGEPRSTDPTSGEMLRMFLVVRDRERGLLAKVYGSATADPATGRLRATFDRNPRVPFERIRVEIRGGERGLIALPRSCTTHTTATALTPWTAAHGGGGATRGVVLRDDGGEAGPAVDLHPRVRVGALGVPVRGEQRGLDGREDGLERDLPLALQRPEGREVDVHASSSSKSSS